nr:WAT1-related protein At5g07050-like [Ziziphus jujuba var. spinosa]
MEEEEAGGVLRGRSRREVASEECIPYLFCIFSAVCFAGFNIISKVYLDKGMSVYVLVAYGHAFGTLTTAFLAFLFERMEKLEISKLGGQAKVGGTAIALAGATTITLYKVIAVISSRTKDSHQTSSSIGSIDKDWIKGSLMLIVSYISLSLFFILQTKTIKMYPAPMTLTALTCLSATLLSTIMTAILDHKAASWRLSWNITLLAPLYSVRI